MAIAVSALSAISGLIYAQVPGCATNIAPANGATDIQLNPPPNLSWNPVAGATGYRVIVRNPAGDTVANGVVATANSAIYGIANNTTFTWYVIPQNASGSAVGCNTNTSTFTTAATIANDNCSGAIALTPLSGYDGITSSSGATQSLAGCNLTTATRDVWYKTTADFTGNMTITASPLQTGGNPVLQVFTGTCASLTSMICDNAAGANSPETHTFAATAGTTYFYRVYHSTGAIASFNIQVTGTALATGMDQLEGEIVAGKTARLNWATKSEEHNKGFEIQRSDDGAIFRTVGFVSSKAPEGNSNEAINYDFSDMEAIAGTAYYRLQQASLDGKTILSNTVRLSINDKDAFEMVAVPNPVKNKLSLKTYGTRGDNAQVLVTDLSGKIVRRINITTAEADIDMTAVANGIYLLKYTDATRTQTIKISKQ